MLNQYSCWLLTFLTYNIQLYYFDFVMLKLLKSVFLDIINCENDDGCHDNATCTDNNGSYVCMCQEGFTGDGFNCTGLWGFA